MDSIDLLLIAHRKKFVLSDTDIEAKQKASATLLHELRLLNGRQGIQLGIDEEFGVCSILPVGREYDPERGVRMRVVQKKGDLSIHVDGQAARPLRGILFDGERWVSDEIDENITPEPGQPVPRKSAALVVLRELLTAMV